MRTNCYLAHINEDHTKSQKLNDHLTGTANYAEQFASVFHSETEARTTALYHDIGKTTVSFQKRLHGAQIRADHSTAGAIEIYKRYRNPIPAICIAGHHAGLPNCGSKISGIYGDGSFCGRMKAKTGCDIKYYENILEDTDIPSYDTLKFPYQVKDNIANKLSLYLYTKMQFSVLTDADFLDTEDFMKETHQRGQYETLDVLLHKLENYVQKWDNAETMLNRYRNRIRYPLSEHRQ